MGGVLTLVPDAAGENSNEGVTDLQMQEVDYEAALVTIDRILHRSLLDFLQ